MQLRQNIVRLSLAFLVIFAFASCITDSYTDDAKDSSGITPGDRVYTFLFQIDTGDIATRATEGNDDSNDLNSGDNSTFLNSGNLVEGSDYEHKIGKEGNYAFFFYNNGEQAGEFFTSVSLELADSTMITNKDHQWHEKVEAIYGAKITIENEDEDGEIVRFPSNISCIIVLNASESTYGFLLGEAKKTNIEQFLGTLWKCNTEYSTEQEEIEAIKAIGYNDNGFFTMTNSSYVKDSKFYNAVPIDVELMKQRVGEFDKEKVITIHVERMLAKFSLKISENRAKEIDEENKRWIFQPSQKADLIFFNGFKETDGSPEYVAKKWQINVTGWNINALENTNFFFKDFDPNANYYNGWNDNANYRTYWAEDNHYNNDSYPWQYRRAMDAKSSVACPYYSANISNSNNENLLRNFSFQSLALDNGNMTKSVYTPENTYNAAAVEGKLDDREELLACSHLLVGAELQIDLDNSDEYVAHDLYRDRNGLYFLSERECLAALIHDFNQYLKSQKTMVFTHYTDWTAHGTTKQQLIIEPSGEYRLYYKNESGKWQPLTEDDILNTETFRNSDLTTAIATLRKGDGKRLPWIDNLMENGRLAIGNNSTQPFITIYETTEDSIGTIVPNKKAIKGYTNDNNTQKGDKNFIKSLLYEWLGAVDHFNNGKMYYAHGIDNPTASEETPNRYGVVRNNWYQFVLNNITSIGIPVDDIYQPIVPERVGLNDQINFTIKILDWHSIEQDIKLPNNPTPSN